MSLFEQRFPQPVQRYAFDHAMLEPFVELWQSGQRPDLPLRPERVTVYALPGQPFLIGYQSGDCVIALPRGRAAALLAMAAAADRLAGLSPAACPNPS